MWKVVIYDDERLSDRLEHITYSAAKRAEDRLNFGVKRYAREQFFASANDLGKHAGLYVKGRHINSVLA
jgi:hypothetical protein